MRNAGLDKAQIGIKIAGRNINNLRYADDSILMTESEEEQNNLLMKMKDESAKVDLKLNIQKTKIMVSSPITSWQIEGEKVGSSDRFSLIFPLIPFPGHRFLNPLMASYYTSPLLESFVLPQFLAFPHPVTRESLRQRSNQSVLKEINLECSVEGLMQKLQYFGYLMPRADPLEKTLMLGKIEGRRRRR